MRRREAGGGGGRTTYKGEQGRKDEGKGQDEQENVGVGKGSGTGSQMAERLGNRASNLKVTGLIPARAKMTLCPWARHFPLLASGECPCTYCMSLWIRASAE